MNDKEKSMVFLNSTLGGNMCFKFCYSSRTRLRGF